MKTLLSKLLGRLPIGWMQLLHNRTRLLAAVGGVTFANVLIFMQLGFMNALFDSSVFSHKRLDADLVLVSSDYKTLREANPIPRARMYEALSDPHVVQGTPLYIATLHWTDKETTETTNFRITGVDPDAEVFVDAELQDQIEKLREPDSAIIDRQTRDFSRALGERIAAGERPQIEMAGRRMTGIGVFEQGASFDVDGAMVVSDQTFLRLFANRVSGAPTLVLLKCQEGTDLERVAKQIEQRLPESDTRVLTKQQFVEGERDYQAKQTPIGFVFGFGVVIGLVVGLVIVYQVLSTDVQDHLSEYATLKAIGYGPGFFRGLVIEESMGLAALGFLPGLVISLVLYHVAARATSLPIAMSLSRPLFVLMLTVVMCAASGWIATRRLNAADPADLF